MNHAVTLTSDLQNLIRSSVNIPCEYVDIAQAIHEIVETNLDGKTGQTRQTDSPKT